MNIDKLLKKANPKTSPMKRASIEKQLRQNILLQLYDQKVSYAFNLFFKQINLTNANTLNKYQVQMLCNVFAVEINSYFKSDDNLKIRGGLFKFIRSVLSVENKAEFGLRLMNVLVKFVSTKVSLPLFQPKVLTPESVNDVIAVCEVIVELISKCKKNKELLNSVDYVSGKILISRLAKSVPEANDYELQCLLVEILFRSIPINSTAESEKNRTKFISDCFAQEGNVSSFWDDDSINLFLKIEGKEFGASCRRLLNYLNRNNFKEKKFPVSFECDGILLSNKKVSSGDGGNLFVDFNLNSFSIVCVDGLISVYYDSLKGYEIKKTQKEGLKVVLFGEKDEFSLGLVNDLQMADFSLLFEEFLTKTIGISTKGKHGTTAKAKSVKSSVCGENICCSNRISANKKEIEKLLSELPCSSNTSTNSGNEKEAKPEEKAGEEVKADAAVVKPADKGLDTIDEEKESAVSLEPMKSCNEEAKEIEKKEEKSKAVSPQKTEGFPNLDQSPLTEVSKILESSVKKYKPATDISDNLSSKENLDLVKNAPKDFMDDFKIVNEPPKEEPPVAEKTEVKPTTPVEAKKPAVPKPSDFEMFPKKVYSKKSPLDVKQLINVYGLNKQHFDAKKEQEKIKEKEKAKELEIKKENERRKAAENLKKPETLIKKVEKKKREESDGSISEESFSEYEEKPVKRRRGSSKGNNQSNVVKKKNERKVVGKNRVGHKGVKITIEKNDVPEPIVYEDENDDDEIVEDGPFDVYEPKQEALEEKPVKKSNINAHKHVSKKDDDKITPPATHQQNRKHPKTPFAQVPPKQQQQQQLKRNQFEEMSKAMMNVAKASEKFLAASKISSEPSAHSNNASPDGSFEQLKNYFLPKDAKKVINDFGMAGMFADGSGASQESVESLESVKPNETYEKSIYEKYLNKNQNFGTKKTKKFEESKKNKPKAEFVMAVNQTKTRTRRSDIPPLEADLSKVTNLDKSFTGTTELSQLFHKLEIDINQKFSSDFRSHLVEKVELMNKKLSEEVKRYELVRIRNQEKLKKIRQLVQTK